MSGKQQSRGGWRKTLWNPETRKFFGRTGESWLKISAYYVIFYAFLGGIFIGTILVLLMTLSAYKPKYQDRIVPSGLSFSPYAANFDIIFKKDDPSSYEKYVNSLKKFIEQYNDEKQTDDMKFEDCGAIPKSYTERGELDSKAGQRKSCRFSRRELQDCSGQNDTTFGFKEGKPCLILKLNRMINFRPTPPSSNDSLPDALKGKSFDNLMPVHCTNRFEVDKGKIGEIKYFGFAGRGGFPLQYYPYYGKMLHPNYLQPLVGVKFTNVTMNKELKVECRVYGGGYEKGSLDGLFYVHLTVKQ
ncbi:sodium/potassium-transporting ATPase subunit beta-233-like [Poecilia latipinna]|uniref:sodium/potassium-transporting ATPase subunit beta-233-like n=1 Tax=Poecilia latipinna TaxID=48699 RepID=UPI00072EC3BB|nr:PREDICTED: sodium/potassium-transporting ATPase subunit beta-233-like [Poecilia latipinna]